MNPLTALFSSSQSLGLLAQTSKGGTMWMPPAASTFAEHVDFTFYYIYWVSLISTVLILGVLAFMIVKYRQRPGVKSVRTPTHNTPLELFWSITPGILVTVMFFWGFKGYLDMYTPPANAYEIQVTAVKWSWEFTYPSGASDSELHLPMNRDVRLVMKSDDVLHSLFIPAFRAKMDVVPGRYQKMWFKPTKLGTYHLFCTEYCGTQHSTMITWAHVLSDEDFDKKMEALANPFERDGVEVPAVEVGELLFKRKGCTQCHTVDGTALTGPSLKGVFGKTENFRDGTSTVIDENYIRESILVPNAKIVLSYDGVMPSYQGRLKERELDALVTYIKSLH